MAPPASPTTERQQTNGPHGERPVVLITGIAGTIGSRLADALREHYRVIGLDLACGDDPDCIRFDITDDDSVAEALAQVRERCGSRLSSVVHLAAYFDFTGADSPMYEAVNEDGTRRLLAALRRDFEVEQFVFSSTMLVHAPTEPGVPIDEDSPLDARWAYPRSKLATERVIEESRGGIPAVFLRIAGVYGDRCGVPAIAHQVQRIYERRLQGRLFSGDLSHGQAYVHGDDAVEAMRRTVERRGELGDGTALLVGEPEAPSYLALQNRIAELVHGESWRTLRIPEPLARLGAWLQEKSEPLVPDAIDRGERPFIRSFMVPLADDHYEPDITRARELLDWEPQHSLSEHVDEMIQALRADPAGWYEANGLVQPDWMDREAQDPGEPEAIRAEAEQLRRREHGRHLWAHFLTVGLGAWLMTAPAILGYESGGLTASDVLSGAVLVVTGLLALSWQLGAVRFASGAVGFWLLFAPLVFHAPHAAAYLNDTLVGALAIGFAMLSRPPPGVGAVALTRGPDVPEGWDFSPSSWTQRLPIIILAFIGLYISRYLAAFQLGHTGAAWDPLFGSGTERVITSAISEAWPVPDAGVGAATYMLEILTGIIGGRARWRTMPWLVVLFGIMIVPLGAISIFFIVIQPIVIGTWCTLCLVAAAAMLVQIPYSLDELVATGQFLAERRRKGRPLLRVFLQGDTAEGGSSPPAETFERPPGEVVHDIWTGGVNLPWNLVASAAIGVLLMCTRLAFGTEPPMAHADHLIGALVVTISVASLAEVGRPLRYLNVLAGLCLLATPWMFDGASGVAEIASVLCGLALVGLALRRGPVTRRYGKWDRYVV